MIIEINIIEVASELADDRLRREWDYRLGDIDIKTEDGVVSYTEEAQNIHNKLYDEFYNRIMELKE